MSDEDNDNVDLVCTLYNVGNKDVLSLLKKDVTVLPTLIDTYSKIVQYFILPDVTLSVLFNQLVIYITVNSDPEEACDILDRLDTDWWLEASEKISDKVSITLRCV